MAEEEFRVPLVFGEFRGGPGIQPQVVAIRDAKASIAITDPSCVAVIGLNNQGFDGGTASFRGQTEQAARDIGEV